MKHLLSLLCLVVNVLGARLYGGYERMFFYYVYLLDSSVNNGKPANIARGCQACSFNQFIQYINNLPSTPSIAIDGFPDIDSTAQALDTSGLTGPYDMSRISPKAGDIVSLFSHLTSTFVGAVPLAKTAERKYMIKAARLAVQRVYFLGSFAHSDDLSAYLLSERSGLSIKKIDRYMPNNKKTVYSFFDLKKTLDGIADVGMHNDIMNLASGFTAKSEFVRMAKISSNITC